MSDLKFIIVGLGNPGEEYKNTRHNTGFMALDYIASRLNVKVSKDKFKGKCSMGEILGKKIFLLKPQTYMNLSGTSLIPAMQFYKLPPNKVILLFDDISIPLGKLRIRKTGSHGGQNGVKNILNLSGSEDFLRIKIGIGNKPNSNWNLSDWVLTKFSESELLILKNILNKVYLALELIVSGDIDKAMNLYN